MSKLLKTNDSTNNNLGYDESMELLLGFSSGYLHSKMFQTIMKYSICDLLEDGPKHFSEISKIICFKDDSYCYRLLRYFVPFKLFNESLVEVGIFSKTSLSTQFSKNGPLKNMGIYYSQDHHYKMFQSLPITLENGISNGPSSVGLSNFWEYFDLNESYKKLFNGAMMGYTTLIDNALPKVDLSTFDTVVDIGGSHGLFIGKLLESYPNIVQGINFDLETVINSNENEKYQHPKLSHVSGDFFISVPESDCYLMKYILHDWSDEKCCEILKTISKSIKPKGKVFIFDLILDPSNYSKDGVCKDIFMMHFFNSKERSLIELKQLINMCGFKIDKIDTSISPSLTIISKQ
ncbi:hypothetical protein ACTA71_004235 [Dictyostelium dimigraforme]